MSFDEQQLKSLKQWPYKEAKGLVKSLKKRKPKSRQVILETGFGPSGLPHIGTFGEVARTTWVKWAYEKMTGEDTLLIAFSDDMDGLRKVPDNLPNKEMLEANLGKPLCDIPDPFGTHESFSGHMNAKLRDFLDTYGFKYEFRAAHTFYRSGAYNDGLTKILQNYEKIRNVILPTLGEEARKSWSPFMPVCSECGRVLGTRVVGTNAEANTISYECDGCGHHGETEVTDGKCKVGWKVDWALRWYTFGVNYEMYGKDLIDSAKLSSKICRILGEQPPIGMCYEMFLDKEGRKISKSKGNGLTIDEWLTYGPLESLGLFIYKNPTRASRLHFDVIPQHVDEYLNHRGRYTGLEEIAQMNSPVWFIDRAHLEAGKDITFGGGITYGILLNLVSALNTESKDVIWEYVRKYNPEANADEVIIDRMIERSLAYYRDFVLPTKVYKLPSEEMQPVVDAFLAWLSEYEGSDAKEIQDGAYAAGKEAGVNLREFFQTFYELLLGQSKGPRLGSFIQLYGVKATMELAKANLTKLAAE